MVDIVPVDLINDPVHHPLEEIPGEVIGFGGHKVGGSHGAEDNNLEIISHRGKTGRKKESECTEQDKARQGRVTYITVYSLITHYPHGTARVDSGVGYSKGSADRLDFASSETESPPWEIWS